MVAMLIYHFAKLRDLAKKEVIRTPEKILDLPITAIDAIETVEQHVEEIAKAIGNDRLEMLKSAIQMIHRRCVEGAPVTPSMTIVALSNDRAQYELVYSSGLTIVAFGDDNSENQLVYSIGVDCGRKRVIVAFRGTITKRDFFIDANFQMTSQLNPLAYDPHQDPLINIHKGFYDYLFNQNYNLGKANNKFDEIIGIAFPLIEKYPDFRLYATGHSLGGALSTLFAFTVASNFSIQKPITCVSCASPKVGGNCFRKAFQLLEKQGKLRHLRVTNSSDPVPMFYPPASCGLLCGALGSRKLVDSSEHSESNKIHKEIYYHVGVKLKLFDVDNASASPYKIKYSKGPSNDGWLTNVTSFTEHFRKRYRLHHHLPKEYIYRLSMVKHELECVYLNDLYESICESQQANRSDEQEFEHGDVQMEFVEESVNAEFVFDEEDESDQSVTETLGDGEEKAIDCAFIGPSTGERCFLRLRSILETFEDENVEEGENAAIEQKSLALEGGESISKIIQLSEYDLALLHFEMPVDDEREVIISEILPVPECDVGLSFLELSSRAADLNILNGITIANSQKMQGIQMGSDGEPEKGSDFPPEKSSEVKATEQASGVETTRIAICAPFYRQPVSPMQSQEKPLLSDSSSTYRHPLSSMQWGRKANLFSNPHRLGRVFCIY